LECLNKFPVFNILDNARIEQLELACINAVEKSRNTRQNSELERLVREQHEELKNLYQELESRIEKRQNLLAEARQKSILANSRWHLILKASEAIQQSESLGEIERSLTDILGQELNILSIRIFSQAQASLFKEQQKNQKNFSVYESILRRGIDDTPIGTIFYLRQSLLPFKKDDTDFLQKISEVISLALDRLYKLDQAYALKEHWEATFDAVIDPVIIIDSQYEILQFNSSLVNKTGLPTSAIKNKKCYQILFSKDSPCQNCSLGKQFQLEGNNSPSQNSEKAYTVFSQSIRSTVETQNIYVNQYHDITEQLKMQAKIIESARMAEVGTIGSSIAHELNNPLGGMLSFAQLIKMELKKDDPIYADIAELEVGIKRCRDIIQNLLSFSRNSDSDKKIKVDLREVVSRSLKIIELQSRSSGIDLKNNLNSEANLNPVYVEGVPGHLTQAIQSILQLSLGDNLEYLRLHKTHKGIIEVRLQQNPQEIQVHILDNGPVFSDRNSLNISVTRQILRDHHGTLEFFPDQKPFKLAKISLPNPASV
jgi:nitrogen-specific signal transduction histidine kinase